MRKKFTCYRCGKYVETEMDDNGDATCPACENVIELEPERRFQTRIASLESELAALKSENVNLSKKVTDYEKELRQSYKYDKTCSTCRYIDENRDCVLGIRCVNYTLWQGKIL